LGEVCCCAGADEDLHFGEELSGDDEENRGSSTYDLDLYILFVDVEYRIRERTRAQGSYRFLRIQYEVSSKRRGDRTHFLTVDSCRRQNVGSFLSQ
jgi:hypothetical protein